jgi:deazaflavin-dependent oxidoreductase (nitroreductase family)
VTAPEYEPSRWEPVAEQVAAYERSGGAETNTLPGTDYPIIVLTTVGARTGKLRKTPVMRVEHDGSYALVASLGGAPTHPLWYWNLTGNPDQVTLQDGATWFEVGVHLLDGNERATWWERAVAAYPDYANYQSRTDRVIPVFLATRRS